MRYAMGRRFFRGYGWVLEIDDNLGKRLSLTAGPGTSDTNTPSKS